MADVSTTTDHPPWALIHFDVHCARCGHDLRGQSEPVCPACHLEFTWEQAAPLEQLTCGKCNYHLYGLSDSRCPECGTTVDWNEALLRYRRREKPLFEYRWRDRPIRSFFHTWLLALRPKRLWQVIDIHDPPMLRPLAFWSLIILACTAPLFPVGRAAMHWWLAFRSPRSRIFRGVTFSDFPTYLIQQLSYPANFAPALMLATYSLFAFLALMILQQSMAMYKVRTAHVIRVVCLTIIVLFPFAVLGYLILHYQLSFVPISTSWFSFIHLNTFGVLTQPFFWLVFLAIPSTIFVGVAYRNYLRMPHSIGVGIASQLIALLSVAALGAVFGWLI